MVVHCIHGSHHSNDATDCHVITAIDWNNAKDCLASYHEPVITETEFCTLNFFITEETPPCSYTTRHLTYCYTGTGHIYPTLDLLLHWNGHIYQTLYLLLHWNGSYISDTWTTAIIERVIYTRHYTYCYTGTDHIYQTLYLLLHWNRSYIPDTITTATLELVIYTRHYTYWYTGTGHIY